MIESAEDLAEFFDPDDFGDVFTITETGAVFNGIFHYPFERAEFKREGARQSAMEISVRYPRIIAPTASVLTLRQHQVVSVQGALYEIVDLLPDGTGLTEIPLREQSSAPVADPQGSPWR